MSLAAMRDRWRRPVWVAVLSNFESFDRDEKSLGLFSTERDAVDAITQTKRED
jgi:hypothetical protein